MSNQLDLSQFTTRQLINLLWEVKATPQAQPLYQELSSRPPQFTLKPDDPDWTQKCLSFAPNISPKRARIDEGW